MYVDKCKNCYYFVKNGNVWGKKEGTGRERERNKQRKSIEERETKSCQRKRGKGETEEIEEKGRKGIKRWWRGKQSKKRLKKNRE